MTGRYPQRCRGASFQRATDELIHAGRAFTPTVDDVALAAKVRNSAVEHDPERVPGMVAVRLTVAQKREHLRFMRNPWTIQDSAHRCGKGWEERQRLREAQPNRAMPVPLECERPEHSRPRLVPS